MEPVKKKQRGSRRAIGGKRVEAIISNERKTQLDAFCQEHKMTTARVVNTALAQLLIPQQPSR